MKKHGKATKAKRATSWGQSPMKDARFYYICLSTNYDNFTYNLGKKNDVMRHFMIKCKKKYNHSTKKANSSKGEDAKLQT